MKSQRPLHAMLALTTALALSGCGGSEPSGNDDSGETGPLLPLSVGNKWEYRVTSAGVVSQKRTTVLDQEPVGGTGPYATTTAFKVVTRKGLDLNSETDLDKTESWQGPASGEPERILRYRELSYGAKTMLLQLEEFWDPPRIHVDGSAEHTEAGARWIEKYKETKLPTGQSPPPVSDESDLWDVVSANEAVEVPFGRFEHSIHLRKTGGSTKEYWYQRGVGKLKEVGDQTEELVTFAPETAP